MTTGEDEPKAGLDPAAKGCGIGCLGLLVAAALLIGWAVIAGDDGNDGGGYVKVACRDWAKDRLKAPGTARFYNEKVDRDGTTYVVTGSVESQNSFGGTVRNTYRCEATRSGDSTELVSLTGLTD